MPHRHLLLVCLVASLVGCKEPPPKVLVGRNRLVQLTVPGSWREDWTLNDTAPVQAARTAAELYAIALAEPKEPLDGADLEDYSELTRLRQLGALKDASERGPERRVANGFPALQYELRGGLPNGKARIAMLHSVVETRGSFLQVQAWTLEGRLEKNREILQKVVDSALVPGERPGRGWDADPPEIPADRELEADDGSVRLVVPGKWRPMTELNDSAVLQAGRKVLASFVIVLVDERAAVPDMDLEAVSQTGRSSILGSLKNGTETGPEHKKVGGHRAVQYRLEGEMEEQRFTMLHATIETPTRYLQVTAWTIAYRFERERKALEAIIDSVREAG